MSKEFCGDFERFQRGEAGFGPVWGQIEGFVSQEVLKGLRKRLVRGWKTADDLAAYDDIVQTVVVRLQELPQNPAGWFDPSKNRRGAAGIWGWLGQICHNEVVNYCRKWRGAGRRLKLESLSDIQLNDYVGRGTNSRCPQEILNLETAELMAIMNDCLAQLPPQHREAIELRYFQELTDRTAGAKIGMAPSTITKRTKAAITQLRKLLGDRNAEGEDGGGD